MPIRIQVQFSKKVFVLPLPTVSPLLKAIAQIGRSSKLARHTAYGARVGVAAGAAPRRSGRGHLQCVGGLPFDVLRVKGGGLEASKSETSGQQPVASSS